MGEHITRFYSLALGKYNNFYNTATSGVIANGDTTPSVALDSLLYVNSAGALTITDLDDGGEGQIVMIHNLGAGVVTLAGSCVTTNSAALAANQNITLRKNITKWYEIARGGASDSATITYTNPVYTAGGSSGTLTVTPNTRLVLLTSNSTNVIAGITGGYQGQSILFIGVGSCNRIAIGSGNIVSNVTTGDIKMLNSSMCIISRAGGQWFPMLSGVLQ